MYLPRLQSVSIFILFLAVTTASFQANSQTTEEAPLENSGDNNPAPLLQNIEVAPDTAELVIDFNEHVPVFLAYHHQYQATFSADPLVNGRLSLGFQLKLDHRTTLDLFVLAENYRFGQFLLQFATPQNLSPVFLQWEISAGFGFKVRLSEWILKTSLFMEPTLALGYYEQEYNQGTYRSIRIRPGLYLGLETIFDNGFMIGEKIGLEYPLDIALQKEGMAVPALLSVLPVLSLGYVW